MPSKITQDAASRVAEVLALVRERIPVTDRERAEAFAREYFRGMDDEDVVTRAPADLYGAALSLLQFAGLAAAGRPRSCACSTRSSTTTAGSRRTRWSRSSTTTCRSSSIR